MAEHDAIRRALDNYGMLSLHMEQACDLPEARAQLDALLAENARLNKERALFLVICRHATLLVENEANWKDQAWSIVNNLQNALSAMHPFPQERREALKSPEADRVDALLARTKALESALREVYDSIPGTYERKDPMVERHAKALNALRALLAPEEPHG